MTAITSRKLSRAPPRSLARTVAGSGSRDPFI
jgi:hypothetical protein